MVLKSDCFGFLRNILNILILSKCGKCSIFGPKINILDFFCSLDFLKILYQMTDIKKWVKFFGFLICKEILRFLRSGINGTFLGPKM